MERPSAILFRADAGHAMGSGHVMRCLALAGELAKTGQKITFLMRDNPGHLAETVSSQGHGVVLLPHDPAFCESHSHLTLHQGWLGATTAQDARECLNGLEHQDLTLPAEWLIVDHYGIDTVWQTQMRTTAKRIMVIDDLADRPHDCDILLDQNQKPNAHELYEKHLPPECLRLLGPQYALLRPEFSQNAQPQVFDENKTHNNQKVLIYLGYGNDQGIVSLAVQAFAKLSSNKRPAVYALISDNTQHADQIQSTAQDNPWLTLLSAPQNMAELLRSIDWVIGAGGTSTWERCSLSIPSLVVSIADNQTELCEATHAAGAIQYLGASNKLTLEALFEHIGQFISTPSKLNEMAAKARQLVDGLGIKRVITAMQERSNLC